MSDTDDLENADWLAIDGPNENQLVRSRPYRKRPKWRNDYILAKRQLNLKQRTFLEQMRRHNFHTRNAWAAMVRDGHKVALSYVRKWREKPAMRTALQLAEEHHLSISGISAQKILQRIDALAEYGDDFIPVRNKYGYVVEDENFEPVLMKRDPHLALKSNELLGKNQRLWGDEDRSARVTVNIVDLSGRVDADDRVIDVSADDRSDS